jgi:hypothetical protein
MSLILIAGVAIFAAFLVLNRKVVPVEREGIVKEVLNKDAFVVEFDDARPSIVRFQGLSMASESEMLDDKIFDFLHKEVRGGRVLVKPQRISTGDVIVGKIYTMTGEYLNATMVRQGFARWSPSEAAEDRDLAEAQKEAKAEQMGVWNPAVRQLLVGRLKDQAEEDSEGLAEDEIPANASEKPASTDPVSVFSSDDTDLNPEAN